MIICVDTSFLIWAIQREARVGQEAMVDAASAMLRDWERQKDTTVFLPAPSLAEFMAGLSIEKKEACQATIAKHFRVLPFDHRCAIIASDLYRRRKSEVQSENNRQKVKVDYQIVSIAFANKADSIVTEDSHIVGIVRIGADRLAVLRPSEYSYQIELPLAPATKETVTASPHATGAPRRDSDSEEAAPGLGVAVPASHDQER